MLSVGVVWFYVLLMEFLTGDCAIVRLSDGGVMILRSSAGALFDLPRIQVENAAPPDQRINGLPSESALEAFENRRRLLSSARR